MEANVNITLPICAELIGGGDPGVNGLNREAVLLVTTLEGAAGMLWYRCSNLAYLAKAYKVYVSLAIVHACVSTYYTLNV